MRKAMLPMMMALTAVTLFLVVVWLQYSEAVRDIDPQGSNAKVFARHYAVISQDESKLWQSVYESAKACAAQENIYLEWVGRDSLEDYTAEDCMNIAIASRVDGIILYPDSSTELTGMIDQATKLGIPVVTVLNDEANSGRASYVGVNSYQMGELYGEQIGKLLEKGKNHIMVLTDSSAENINSNIMYAQMCRTIEQEKKDGEEIAISNYYIDSNASFDAEEVIRNIFVNSRTLPDILVCLDAVSTECACQAVVDYNEVGNVDIVGYYISDTILDAVSKGLLSMTIAIDAGQVGQYSVEALTEYLSQGYVSNYFNVGLEVVSRENVNQLIAQRQEEEA